MPLRGGTLNGVSQVEQPHRPRDLLTPDALRDSLGVPPREDLPQRIAYPGGKAEPAGQLSGAEAM
jgi:hypothetical protein